MLKGLFLFPSIVRLVVKGSAAGLLVLVLAASSFAQNILRENSTFQPDSQVDANVPETIFSQQATAADGAEQVPNGGEGAFEFVADTASSAAVIDLSPALTDTRVIVPPEPGAAWFTVYIKNTGDMPGTRVLQAIDPPVAGVGLRLPVRRLTLLEVAGSDAAMIIERAEAFGSNVFRIIVPPMHTSVLAFHFDGVGPAPTLLAWTESALIAHNRQVSLLVGMIGGLFVAAMAFAGGATAFGGRPFVKWSALFLAALLSAFLTASQVFDDSWLTYFSGPYGLFALALSLAIVAGGRLINHVASFEAFWPSARYWADGLAIVVVMLGLAAWLGMPGAGLLVRILTVIGSAAAACYLIHCGHLGVAGARRVAPAAVLFALVTAVAAFRVTGLMGASVMADSVIAGFSAVGAILIALSCTVGSVDPTAAQLQAMRRAHLKDDI